MMKYKLCGRGGEYVEYLENDLPLGRLTIEFAAFHVVVSVRAVSVDANALGFTPGAIRSRVSLPYAS